MEQKQLRDDLLRLHKELSSVASLDSESEQLLSHIKNDIQKVLQHKGESIGEPHSTLLRRLTNSTEYFEISHPKLIAIVDNIVATLNNLGI